MEFLYPKDTLLHFECDFTDVDPDNVYCKANVTIKYRYFESGRVKTLIIWTISVDSKGKEMAKYINETEAEIRKFGNLQDDVDVFMSLVNASYNYSVSKFTERVPEVNGIPNPTTVELVAESLIPLVQKGFY